MKLRKILLRSLLILTLILIVLGLIYRDLVSYGLMQLKGQLTVVREAIPLEEFVKLETTTDEQKQSIDVILAAKAFAFEELGINYSENYSTIFDQKGKPSMYVISGCDPFAFKPRTWSFPIVGSFPYKGFFEREKAIEELKLIREEEKLDVGLRTAGGWSTLGWFIDPVLSNMLKRSEGDLASLIIHELTHGTIFVKDSVRFNENLANFIGDRGAELFLAKKYGEESEELRAFQVQRADETKFRTYMLDAAQSLDSLYKSFDQEEDSVKYQLKTAQIELIKQYYDTVQFESDRYKGYFDDYTPNNTYFMSMLRYNSQEKLLAKELEEQFGGDLKRYLAFLKEKYPTL
jgi:predicted aminopeptidase